MFAQLVKITIDIRDKYKFFILLLLSSNFFDSSITTVEETISKIRDDLSKKPRDINLNKKLAEILLKNQNEHRVHEAGESVKIILEQNPADVDAKILKTRTYRLLNDFDNAQFEVDNLLETDPKNPNVLEEKGRIYLDKNNFPLAEHWLSQALGIDPDNSRIGRALSLALSAQEKKAEEITLLNMMNHRNPSDFRTVQYLAFALSNDGRTEKSISLLENFRKEHPQEFTTPIWSHDGIPASLPYTLAHLYFISAKEKMSEKKLKLFQIEFNDDEPSIVSGITSETRPLIEKALHEYDLILSKNASVHDLTGNDLTHTEFEKCGILFYLQKYGDSLSIIQKILKTNSTEPKFLSLHGIIQFCLQNYAESVNSFEKLLEYYPSVIGYRRWKCDSLRASGDVDAYHKEQKILEEFIEKAKTNESISNKPKKKFPSRDYSLNPETPLDNFYTMSEFFHTRTGNILKICDGYFQSNYIHFLSQNISMDEIKEIHVLKDLYAYESGLEFFGHTNKLPSLIKKFNEQNKPCKLTVKVARLTDFHDRYAITPTEVWNIPGWSNIEDNKISDLFPIENKEGVKVRRDQFDKIWNDVDSLELNKTNWPGILEELEILVEKSGKEKLHHKVKSELYPTIEYSTKSKAIRDHVPSIVLKKKGVSLTVTTLDDDEFIKKMHLKIREELEEYIEAARLFDKIISLKKEVITDEEKLSQGIDDEHLPEKIKGRMKSIQKYGKKLKDSGHPDPLAELTDILEAVYRMAELRGCTAEELDKLRCDRAKEFGRFDENLFLHLDEPDKQ